jgi:hypothetical protein
VTSATTWFVPSPGDLRAGDADPIAANQARTYTREGTHNFRTSNVVAVTEPVAFESRYARNGRGAPDVIVPPLKAQSGLTGKGDSAPLVAIEPQSFDWQAGGSGADKSFRGKSRSYIVDKPGRTRALTANKTLAVAFSCKDSAQDVSAEVSPTLRGMSEVEGNANAGGQVAVAFSLQQLTSPDNRSNPQPNGPGPTWPGTCRASVSGCRASPTTTRSCPTATRTWRRTGLATRRWATAWRSR